MFPVAAMAATIGHHHLHLAGEVFFVMGTHLGPVVTAENFSWSTCGKHHSFENGHTGHLYSVHD